MFFVVFILIAVEAGTPGVKGHCERRSSERLEFRSCVWVWEQQPEQRWRETLHRLLKDSESGESGGFEPIFALLNSLKRPRCDTFW